MPARSSSTAPGHRPPGPSAVTLEDPATGAVPRPGGGQHPRRGRGGPRRRRPRRTTGAWPRLPAETRRAPRRLRRRPGGARRRHRRAGVARAPGCRSGRPRPLGFIVTGSFRLAAAQLRRGLAHPDHDPRRRPARHRGAAALGAGRCASCRGTRPRRWPRTRPRTRSPRAAPPSSSPASTRRTAPRAARVVRPLDEAAAARRASSCVHGGPEVGAALVGDPRVRAVSFTGGVARRPRRRRGCARTDFNRAAARARRQQPAGRAARRRLGRRRPRRRRPAHHAQRPVVPGARPARRAARTCSPSLLAAIGERLAALRVGDPARPRHRARPARAQRPPRARSRPAMLDLAAGRRTRSPTCPPAGTSSRPPWSPAPPRSPARRRDLRPVATVHAYGTVEEAVALANDTAYGLEGYVFGTDERPRWPSPAGSAPAR